jgi:amylosucrase
VADRVFSFGGIPLIYMGDELAMFNDAHWPRNPACADDNRWMHRSPMNWEKAARRADPSSLESRVFVAFRALIDVSPGRACASRGTRTRRLAARSCAQTGCNCRRGASHG